MRRFLFLLVFALAACARPLDTPLPANLEDMEAIKPAIEKLAPQERELLGGYVLRHTIGSAFGVAFGAKPDPIPPGMTLGKAIAEQRQFVADSKKREEEKKAAQIKREAERDAILAQIERSLVIALADFQSRPNMIGSREMGREVSVVLNIANQGEKAIAGVKGVMKFSDKFGDPIASMGFKTEDSIPVGSSIQPTFEYDANPYIDSHVRFGQLTLSTAHVKFLPSVILFEDGSRVEAPAESP